MRLLCDEDVKRNYQLLMIKSFVKVKSFNLKLLLFAHSFRRQNNEFFLQFQITAQRFAVLVSIGTMQIGRKCKSQAEVSIQL